jgi:hypothetical protein
MNSVYVYACWSCHRWVYAEADRIIRICKGTPSHDHYAIYPNDLYSYMSRLDKDHLYGPSDKFVLYVDIMDPEEKHMTRFCFKTSCLNEICDCGTSRDSDDFKCERRLRLLKP